MLQTEVLDKYLFIAKRIKKTGFFSEMRSEKVEFYSLLLEAVSLCEDGKTLLDVQK